MKKQVSTMKTFLFKLEIATIFSMTVLTFFHWDFNLVELEFIASLFSGKQLSRGVLYKGCSVSRVFLWILQIFSGHLFWPTFENGSFWKSLYYRYQLARKYTFSMDNIIWFLSEQVKQILDQPVNSGFWISLFQSFATKI